MIKKYREFIFATVLVVLIVANVFLTVSVSASGAELNNIERQKEEILAENLEINDKITDASSLVAVGKKAEELGFGKPTSIIYVQIADSVAKLP